MKIRLRGLGLFREYLGENQHLIELAEKATVQDLLLAVKQRWAAKLPDGFLQAGTVVLVEGRVIPELDAPLGEDQEVLLLKLSVGG
jgi:molybdopterin converting factor small subunit